MESAERATCCWTAARSAPACCSRCRSTDTRSTTVEGLGEPDAPHPAQAALHRTGGAAVRLLHAGISGLARRAVARAGGPRRQRIAANRCRATSAAAPGTRRSSRPPEEPRRERRSAGDPPAPGTEARATAAADTWTTFPTTVLLHVAFVRSTHPHAIIRAVDASAALAVAGVRRRSTRTATSRAGVSAVCRWDGAFPASA